MNWSVSIIRRNSSRSSLVILDQSRSVSNLSFISADISSLEAMFYYTGARDLNVRVIMPVERASETSGGLRLDAEVDWDEGSISINTDVDSAGPLPGPGVTTGDAVVRVVPTGVSRLRSSIRSLPRRLSNEFGMSRQFLSSVITTNDIPRGSDFRFSEDIGALELLPQSDSFGLEFEPVRVPSVERSPVDDMLSPVNMTIEIIPTGILRRFVSQLPSVDIEIPPNAFVEEVDINDFGCENIYSNVESQLSRLEQKTVNLEQLEEDVSELESIKQEILSSSTVGSLSDINRDSLQGVSREIVTDWRNRAQEVEPDPIPGTGTISSLSSDIDNVDSTIEQMPGGGCKGGFVSREMDVRNDLRRLDTLSDRARELKREILDNLPRPGQIPGVPCIERDFNGVSGQQIVSGLDSLESSIDELSRISINATTVEDFRDNLQGVTSNLESVESDISSIPSENECFGQFMSRLRNLRGELQDQRNRLPDVGIELDCSDVPQFIRNSVAEAETAARSFSNARASSITRRRFNRIKSNIEDARSIVEDRVDEENPCKEQLLGRLDSAESIIGDSFPPERGALSCDSEFPTIDERLTRFEEDVIDLDPPVDTETFEDMLNRADGIIQQIEDNVDRERCARQFTRRVDGILSRVGDVGARTRVVTAAELTEEQVDERREAISELENRLGQIEQIEFPNPFDF